MKWNFDARTNERYLNVPMVNYEENKLKFHRYFPLALTAFMCLIPIVAIANGNLIIIQLSLLIFGLLFITLLYVILIYKPYQVTGKIELTDLYLKISDLSGLIKQYEWRNLKNVKIAYLADNQGQTISLLNQYKSCWIEFEYESKKEFVYFLLLFDPMAKVLIRIIQNLDNPDLEVINFATEKNIDRKLKWKEEAEKVNNALKMKDYAL